MQITPFYMQNAPGGGRGDAAGAYLDCSYGLSTVEMQRGPASCAGPPAVRIEMIKLPVVACRLLRSRPCPCTSSCLCTRCPPPYIRPCLCSCSDLCRRAFPLPSCPPYSSPGPRLFLRSRPRLRLSLCL